MNDDHNFIFERPPSAPIFRPTLEEFSDPIEYISGIRNIVEKFGICKIIPPKEWQPPFCIDNDKFKFVPRLQRLNELEANTRIKLDFIDGLSKFWSLQGTKLKIPIIEKQHLDFYQLHQIVAKLGGFERIQHTKKWTQVAQLMKLTDSQTPKMLKTYYEKLLYPFDVFKAGVMLQIIEKDTKDKQINNDKALNIIESPKKKLKRNNSKVKEIESIICLICKRGDDESNILLCDDCDSGYHTYCLYPPLDKIPKGEWRCPKCVTKECNKKINDSYGFEQSAVEFSLAEFGLMADQFKRDYFKKTPHSVSEVDVEREFWRLLSSVNANVTVQYGADLHSKDVGSGFPSIINNKLTDDTFNTYLNSKWNLNNLTQNQNSVLSFLNVDISGMKIPWVYVGMCFSCFCWHVEDHWSYSINYLHFGEAKTWYGVSGAYAEKFEDVMKQNASELFEKSPDLLHHLVTIMNPNILMKNGVPISRLDQHAGEFVVTFPRAYHAGFNQGFNFAEAVNFCPPDWMQVGRAAVENYKQIKRLSVFSHEELICTLAMKTDMNIEMAKVIEYELTNLIDFEKTCRKVLLDKGVNKSTKEIFENLQDDERICDYCKGTCYVSAVYCDCSSTRLVCINHYEHLCKCSHSNYTLKYRYTMDDLLVMLGKLKIYCERFDSWSKRVKELLFNETNDVNEFINELKVELKFAQQHQYVNYDSLAKQLEKCLRDYEKFTIIVQSLNIKKEDSIDSRIEFSEFKNLLVNLNKIPCFKYEITSNEHTFTHLYEFREKINNILNSGKLNSKTNELKEVLDESKALPVRFKEIETLKYQYEQSIWLEKLNMSIDNTSFTIDSLKNLIESAQKLEKHDQLDKSLEQLQDLLSIVELFNKKIENILHESSSYSLNDLEVWVDKAKLIPVQLSSVNRLIDIVIDAKNWYLKVDQALNEVKIDSNKLLLLKDKSQLIPINLTIKLNDLNAKLNEIETFHREINLILNPFNVINDIMNILQPGIMYKRHYNKIIDENTAISSNYSKISDSFELNQYKEIELIEKLRELNVQKFQINFKSKLNKDLTKKCSICHDNFIDNSNLILSRPILCEFCNRCESIQIDVLKDLLVKVLQSNLTSNLTEAFVSFAQRCVQCEYELKMLLNLPVFSKVVSTIKNLDVQNYNHKQIMEDYMYIDDSNRFLVEKLHLECLLLNFKCHETTLIILMFNILNKHTIVKEQKQIYPTRSSDRNKRKLTNTNNGDVLKLRKKSSSTLSVSKSQVTSDDTQSEDEKCALENCLLPKEDNIKWVQCDGNCNKWFHMACVGLKRIKLNDQYICDLCTKNKEPKPIM